ncbi:MAG: dTMP kinase [Candidatus Sericytochromatia bacterium]
MFITFEGVEGAGKSTQLNNLQEYLNKKGLKTIITRQPGGSELGKQIRNLILNPNLNDKPSDLSEMFLYLADRAHHIEKVILPALNQGIIVICDRYIDSHIAYQGYARGFDIDKLKYLNAIASKNLIPNITFLFDLDPVIGLNRVRFGRNQDVLDRIESERIEFHQKVREGFLEIAKENNRFKILDASLSQEEIKKQIIEIFEYTFSNSILTA